MAYEANSNRQINFMEEVGTEKTSYLKGRSPGWEDVVVKEKIGLKSS